MTPEFIKGTYETTPSYAIVARHAGLIVCLKAFIEIKAMPNMTIVGMGPSLRVERDPKSDVSVAHVGQNAAESFPLPWTKRTPDMASIHKHRGGGIDGSMTFAGLIENLTEGGMFQVITKDLEALPEGALLYPVKDIIDWYIDQMRAGLSSLFSDANPKPVEAESAQSSEASGDDGKVVAFAPKGLPEGFETDEGSPAGIDG